MVSQESAKGALYAAFGCAATLSLIEAIFDPNGWLWTAVRVFALGLLIIALLIWLVFFKRWGGTAGPRH